MASRNFSTFQDFARFVSTTPRLQRQAIDATAAFASKAIKRKAHEIIGSDKLQDLAPSTQAERERLGYSPNDPLVRDGKLLKRSIESDWSPLPGGGAVAGVGSSEPVFAYQEFGTATIPARPVLKKAGEAAMPEIDEAITLALAAAFGFRPALPTRILPDSLL